MTTDFRRRLTFLAAVVLIPAVASAQEQTPPLTVAEREAAYVAAIQKRAEDILVQLALSDAAKSNKVTEIIVTQYRALRTRDEAIDAKMKAAVKESFGADRATLFETMTKPLHEGFLAKLAAELTPAQVETVKDKMTYNKVKVTYDAYCAIVPGLTDADKAKIQELLKAAREEAIDGGSAAEKTQIFQRYKDRINAYLDAHGHDVAKAYADWNAKQEAADKAKQQAAAPASPK